MIMRPRCCVNKYKDFTIINWNVNFRSSAVLDYFEEMKIRPEIICLQEVTNKVSNKYIARLNEIGMKYVYYSGNESSQEKKYGNLIAAHWPIIEHPLQPNSLLKWPQLLAHVTVNSPFGSFELINAHVPNGSSNGWAKIDTFDCIRNLVLQLRGKPLIVTGDFNEPQYLIQDDRIVTFGQKQQPNGRYEATGNFRGDAATRWNDSVRWFFESQDEHGLRHAFWTFAGKVILEPTHINRGAPRWFDHALISPNFEVINCSYDHSVRKEKAMSDHSSLILQVRISA